MAIIWGSISQEFWGFPWFSYGFQVPKPTISAPSRSDMDEATRRSAADSLDAMLHMVLFAVEAVK
jgi:hypothetical protein